MSEKVELIKVRETRGVANGPGQLPRAGTDQLSQSPIRQELVRAWGILWFLQPAHRCSHGTEAAADQSVSEQGSCAAGLVGRVRASLSQGEETQHGSAGSSDP